MGLLLLLLLVLAGPLLLDLTRAVDLSGALLEAPPAVLLEAVLPEPAPRVDLALAPTDESGRCEVRLGRITHVRRTPAGRVHPLHGRALGRIEIEYLQRRTFPLGPDLSPPQRLGRWRIQARRLSRGPGQLTVEVVWSSPEEVGRRLRLKLWSGTFKNLPLDGAFKNLPLDGASRHLVNRPIVLLGCEAQAARQPRVIDV